MFGVEKKSDIHTPPMTPYNQQSVDLFAAGVRCSQCRTMCDNSDVSACQHCKLVSILGPIKRFDIYIYSMACRL